MNVLLLEDRGVVAYYLSETLEDEGHTVFVARTVSKAKTIWENEKENIGCVIVDFNMETVGLTDDEIKKTQGGLFTGWEWLKNYVFSDKPEMRKKTIILSAYIKDFREMTRKTKAESDVVGIQLISKNPLEAFDESTKKTIIELVDEINKKSEG